MYSSLSSSLITVIILITYFQLSKFCQEVTIGLSAKPRQAFINQEHTQNLLISTAHTTRVKADDPVCANPQVPQHTHTHYKCTYVCTLLSAPCSHTQSIYTSCHDHTILGAQNSKRTLGDSLLLQLLLCLSLPLFLCQTCLMHKTQITFIQSPPLQCIIIGLLHLTALL